MEASASSIPRAPSVGGAPRPRRRFSLLASTAIGCPFLFFADSRVDQRLDHGLGRRFHLWIPNLGNGPAFVLDGAERRTLGDETRGDPVARISDVASGRRGLGVGPYTREHEQ